MLIVRSSNCSLDRTSISINKLEFLQYRAFSTPCNSELSVLLNRHPCLADRAWLKHFKSLNPIPAPIALGRQSVSHRCQCIFFSGPHEPHQKRANTQCIPSVRPSGILNMLLIHMGIDCAIALINTSFLGPDQYFSIQS